MPRRRLQTRFVLAGGLLVMTTVACGAWCAVAFAHLVSVVDQAVRDNQQRIDLASALAGALEREDDALLPALGGNAAAAAEQLPGPRQVFDETLVHLDPLLTAPEQEAAAALRQHVAEYRQAGNHLLTLTDRGAAQEYYQRAVNPALRRAVAACGRIRELGFKAMQQAGIRARDVAHRATWIVALISGAALCLSTLVSVRLARSVVRPVRALMGSFEAVAHGNFDQRLPVEDGDELSLLAEGFNQMAQTLADYRSSSLGELLQAKATLEAALSAMPDAVIVVDPDGQVISANPLAKALLQAAGRGEARGLEDLPLTGEGVRTVREAIQGQSARGNRSDLNRVLPISLDGHPIKLALGVAPIADFWPRRQGAVIVLGDVTDFARLDELRGELVAVASHELKTPLTAVGMSIRMLREELPQARGRQQELLDAALEGVEELGATIDELLDLTRIEAGQLRLACERIDVPALVEQTGRTFRPRFEDAEITLNIEAEAAGSVVHGDAARLRIVMANLLSNALKYTPRHGRVTVAVSAPSDPGPRQNWELLLTVRDTGPGVPVEFRERVFEKFFRVEHQRPAGSHDVRGVGIGLYLCREIVEAHKGSISCGPGDDGRGTRFTIRLPGARG